MLWVSRRDVKAISTGQSTGCSAATAEIEFSDSCGIRVSILGPLHGCDVASANPRSWPCTNLRQPLVTTLSWNDIRDLIRILSVLPSVEIHEASRVQAPACDTAAITLPIASARDGAAAADDDGDAVLTAEPHAVEPYAAEPCNLAAHHNSDSAVPRALETGRLIWRSIWLLISTPCSAWGGYPGPPTAAP